MAEKGEGGAVSDAGRAGIMGNLNAELNRPQNLQKMSTMFTENLAKVLDDTMGGVAAGQLPSGQQAPNPVDMYLFDRVRYALGNPASQFFVPRVILGVNDPKLEPDHIDTINLGAQSVEGVNFTSLKLMQVVVTGISNAMTPAAQLVFRQEQGDVDGVVALSTLSPPPVVSVGGQNIQVPAPPLKLTGNFGLTVEGDDTLLTGSAVITVARSQINATMHFSGADAATLVITFKSIRLGANTNDIAVTLSIDSAFTDIINEMINQPSVKQKVLDGVNERASGDLDKLSQAATDNARKVIAQKLDG